MVGKTSFWLSLLLFLMFGGSFVGLASSEPQSKLDYAIHNLENGDVKTRQRAAVQLSGFKDARVAMYLIVALNDENDEVKRLVIAALGKQEDLRATEPLLQMLSQEKGVKTRVQVVKALGLIGDVKAFDPLVLLLRKTSLPVHREVARALGNIPHPRAIDYLLSLATHHDALLRANAMESLGKHLDDPRTAAPLKQAIQDSSPEVRSKAVSALIKTEKFSTIRPFLIAAKDKSPKVRSTAVRSLAFFEDKRVLGVLIQALKDSSSEVREGAAASLGALKDRRALGPLREAMMYDSDFEVRRWARKSVKYILGVKD